MAAVLSRKSVSAREDTRLCTISLTEKIDITNLAG